MADRGSPARFNVLLPIIEAGTAVRASTGEIWAEIRGWAAENGVDIGGAWSAVNSLRSGAVARRNGAELFQRSPDGAPFVRQMAAPEFNARSEADFAVLPMYLARFDLTFLDSTGTPVTKTVSVRDHWGPDTTVGDVRAAVAEAAEGLGNMYGVGAVSWGNIRPVRI